MNNQIEGQLSIFDILDPEEKRKPCEYTFQRYIGQRVRSKSKYGVDYVGIITGIGPYFTDILTDDRRQIVGTPYDVWPLEMDVCGNCKYFRTYVDAYTCEPIGTICVKDDTPLSRNASAEDQACKDWKKKGDKTDDICNSEKDH